MHLSVRELSVLRETATSSLVSITSLGIGLQSIAPDELEIVIASLCAKGLMSRYPAERGNLAEVTSLGRRTLQEESGA